MKENFEKLMKLADAMYYAAKYLTTDASRLHKAMDEYHKFIIHECKGEPTIPDIVDEHFDEMLGEEPVSEDVWESSKRYALLQVLASTDAEMTEQAYLSLKLFSGFEIAVAHKDGANWQAGQFEKNRLKHCDSITNEQAELESGFIDQHLDKYNRMPTFLDAIEYGMKLQEQLDNLDSNMKPKSCMQETNENYHPIAKTSWWQKAFRWAKPK